MLAAAEILNATILVVDDQEAYVTLLDQLLRDEGYVNITTTQDPRQVAGLHAQHSFDLILLDLQMPEMHGFEVIEELKKINDASYLPVMVITAQPEQKLQALQMGAKDFISKPFDVLEVKTRIRNMLEVRLLYRRLSDHSRLLEETVRERTAELRESEARFQRFTELSSDWYWEQDAAGKLKHFYGPVEEMLGITRGMTTEDLAAVGWNLQERAALHEKISNRQPFLDFIYTRTLPNQQVQYLQVSGEPIFDAQSNFIGYRGIGLDISDRKR